MSTQSPPIKALLSGLIITTLLAFSASMQAGERENRIIDQAVNAYGGDKLIQLKSLHLSDQIQHYSQWQSGHSLQGPMITYLSEQQIELSIDLVNHRKVFKQATQRLVGSHGNATPSVTHQLFTDGKGYLIDHAWQQYRPSGRISFDNADRGFSDMLDTLIIRQLNLLRSASQWTDIAYIQGEAQNVLTVNSGTENEYVLYIAQETGYLSRVLRKRGAQMRSYDFLQHHKNAEITWAKQLLVSTAEKPIYHANDRKIRVNAVATSAFNMPDGYHPSPKMKPVDVSQHTIRELANGVYFVGSGWSYTLFIDAGEHLISAGAWQMDSHSNDWQNALALLRQNTGNQKPVKQHIVTHHHNDHMMGLADVITHDASLVIHPADIAAVQNHLSSPLPAARFVTVSDTQHLANGKVMLFDIPNSHANHNIVIYLPEHKILFTEDMFGSSFENAFHSPANWPDGDTYFRLDVLMSKLNQLGLKVEQYLSSHHKRILTQSDIEQALQLPRPTFEVLRSRLFASQ